MSELIFEVTQEADGGFCTECLTEPIFTQADTWEQLRDNVREAVHAYYFDQPKNLPSSIRLHMVRDEILACA
jgi:hypothetical protein